MLFDLVWAMWRGEDPNRYEAARGVFLATRRVTLIPILALVLTAPGCQQPYSGEEPPPDEALVRAMNENPPKTVEQAAVDYFKPKEIDDYFKDMDTLSLPPKGTKDWPDQLLDKPSAVAGATKRVVEIPKLTDQEAFGRNAWMIWCAGNEGFWDWLANNSYGSTDFLKLLDSRARGTLFRDAGLINEPEMVGPGGSWGNRFRSLVERPQRFEATRQSSRVLEAGVRPD